MVLARPVYFQERLYNAMKGLGTNDDSLIRIIVGRSEIDLQLIKEAFDDAREKPLVDMVIADTSGSFQEILLALIGAVKPSALLPGAVNKPKHRPLASTTKVTLSLVAQGVVQRSMLDSDDVFVFDNGFEVFAWVGKNSSKVERKSALQYAQNYLVQYKKPLYLPISRILEGGENEIFEASFDPEKK